MIELTLTEFGLLFIIFTLGTGLTLFTIAVGLIWAIEIGNAGLKHKDL